MINPSVSFVVGVVVLRHRANLVLKGNFIGTRRSSALLTVVYVEKTLHGKRLA